MSGIVTRTQREEQAGKPVDSGACETLALRIEGMDC